METKGNIEEKRIVCPNLNRSWKDQRSSHLFDNTISRRNKKLDGNPNTFVIKNQINDWKKLLTRRQEWNLVKEMWDVFLKNSILCWRNIRLVYWDQSRRTIRKDS